MAEASSSTEHRSVIVSDGSHAVDAIALRAALIGWGRMNFRDFPWRFTDDPYCILMAEVMLHRTQARQVVPVYERFIEKYPDLYSLAEASEEELHTVLYSLGLRWRVRLIYEMAAELVDRYRGEIPIDRESLLALPGISDYIASAFRCFAWNQSDALIDTNTVRIVARLFGVPIKDSLRRNKRFMSLVAALVDPEQPKPYNYALLDLANKICLKSKLPVCQSCPVRSQCLHGNSFVSQNLIQVSSFKVAESSKAGEVAERDRHTGFL
jgi:A/G-specific adenine glycosylase